MLPIVKDDKLSQTSSFHELVESQRKYYRSGITAKLEYRKKQLLTLKKMIMEESEILTDAVYKDLRRLPDSTYSLEIAFVLMEIDYFLNNLNDWSSPQIVQKTFLNLLDSMYIIKEPLGVVLIIAPWNYPLCLILLPLIPAIAAGNTVVIKPSELAPHTSLAFQDLFSQYFDARFLTVVNGGIPETKELLTVRFDHILYTGNPNVAQYILAAAAKHLTPVTLELGGKNPVVVEGDADLKISAYRIVWGKWVNCGQTCLSPDHILVNASVKPRLVIELVNSINEFYGSEPRKSVDYGRIINQKHYDRLLNLIDRTNGTILYKGGELDREDLFIPPIIIDISVDDILMTEEIFGPILPIITVADLDESINFIRSKEKPLAIYLFTRCEKKMQKLCAETSSGGITVNDVVMHIVADTLPFGGVGNSGMGRYHGKFGFDTFTHEKAVLKRSFFADCLLAMRYPPLTDRKFAIFKLFLSKRIAIPRWIKPFLTHAVVLITGLICGFLIQRFVRQPPY